MKLIVHLCSALLGKTTNITCDDHRNFKITNNKMAPTSASLKTHTGHGNRRDGSSTRENGGGGVGDSEDATHFERHLNGTPGRHRSSSGDPRHRPRRAYHHNHRRFDNLRVDDDGAGVIPTPLQVRESSEVRVSDS